MKTRIEFASPVKLDSTHVSINSSEIFGTHTTTVAALVADSPEGEATGNVGYGADTAVNIQTSLPMPEIKFGVYYKVILEEVDPPKEGEKK